MARSGLLGNVSEVEMEPLPLDEGQSQTALHPFLSNLFGARIGVWEVKKGAVGGVPEEEVFVVISGSATVTFENTGEVIEVGPGSVVRLGEGEPNSWVVHEDLRKVYINATNE